jgi:hypothetical protein
MFYIYLVAMDPSCNSYADTNLASLHYVRFIEPLVVLPTEELSFDSKQFTNNLMEKVIEGKLNGPFILLEEHLFAVVMLYKTKWEVQFEDLLHEVLDFFSEA